MAPESPLVLVECGYPDCLVDWRVLDGNDPSAMRNACTTTAGMDLVAGNTTRKTVSLKKPKELSNDVRVMAQLANLWRSSSIKELQLRTLIKRYVDLGSCLPTVADVQSDGGGGGSDATSVVIGTHAKGYVKLMDRSRCNSVQEAAQTKANNIAARLNSDGSAGQARPKSRNKTIKRPCIK
ncbi:hypothetical protein BSLG_002395 [Batrachochytrium salamandrivorans]|nr:hypothetical protein BSLG_002395 [Batrachochytrium salamandrivorans]